MIEVLSYTRGSESAKLRSILSRSCDYTPQLEGDVRKIVADVRERGDVALFEQTARLDGADLAPAGLQVPGSDLESASRTADRDLIDAIRAAAGNIRRFHEAQRRTSWFTEEDDGVILGKRVLPLERVGLLIPGASAPLFSTLLMAAIPAQVAGVPQICVATPPRPDGTVHPTVLATAHLLGLNEVYRVFGAQGVAALAYGTESIPPVDKLVGPGHPAVQIAKKLVVGTCDIDMIAGPSEVVVIADGTAEARFVAADLLSQAEHGSGFEAVVCITPSAELAAEVCDELERQAARLSRRESIQKALDSFGAVFVVADLAEAVELANRIAPEHLELIVQDPWAHLSGIRNAGAVFLGPASPEPVGDYYAGTNHILPTAGSARFSSSVGVDTFLKTISIVSYTERRLRKAADHIIRLAEAEGLDAHAQAVRTRL
jgi:histidinol dehydrogenase